MCCGMYIALVSVVLRIHGSEALIQGELGCESLDIEACQSFTIWNSEPRNALKLKAPNPEPVISMLQEFRLGLGGRARQV